MAQSCVIDTAATSRANDERMSKSLSALDICCHGTFMHYSCPMLGGNAENNISDADYCNRSYDSVVRLFVCMSFMLMRLNEMKILKVVAFIVVVLHSTTAMLIFNWAVELYWFHTIDSISSNAKIWRWEFDLTGNIVGLINKVNWRQAWLVLGWVMADTQINHVCV